MEEEDTERLLAREVRRPLSREEEGCVWLALLFPLLAAPGERTMRGCVCVCWWTWCGWGMVR